MTKCVINGCGNTPYSRQRDPTKGNLRFYTVPKVRFRQCQVTLERSQKRLAAWIQAINRPDVTVENVEKGQRYHVCSEHFVGGSSSSVYLEDSVNWVPTLKLGPPVVESSREEREANVVSPATPSCSGFPGAQELFGESTGTPEYGMCETSFTYSPQNLSGFDVLDDSQSDSQTDNDLQKAPSANQSLQDRLSDALADKFELECKLTESNQNNTVLQKRIETLEKWLREEAVKRSKLEKETTTKIQQLSECVVYKIDTNAMVSKGLKSLYHNIDVLKSDEEQLKFYTGLISFGVFNSVLNRCTKFLRDHHRHLLQPWQRLLLTLMRIRLCLLLKDLAFRFGVSKTTAGDIFNTWIDILYKLFCPLLIRWPEREILQKVTPREFRESYGSSVVCIIDCFELFCEKPSSLEPRGQVWSNYKHHHTIKVLIAISPCGVISFVSTCWAGRSSDQEVAGRSGLYKLLLPYDVIMADRGFKIADAVNEVGAKLLIPAFTKGLSQLSSGDIELTRKVAHLRVHVERVIGLVRNKYRFLQTRVPIDILQVKKHDTDGLASIDKIVKVCCALTNLSPSIVHRGSLQEENDTVSGDTP